MPAKFYTFILLSLILTGCGLSKRISDADKKFAAGEYFDAGNLYKSVLPVISNKQAQLKGKIAFRQGECFRLIDYPAYAEQAYQKAVKINYTDSLVNFRYAQSLQRNGKYADAIKFYKSFLKSKPADVNALNQLWFLSHLDSIKKEPTFFKSRKNTVFNVRRANTFSPFILPSNEEVLFFTSTRQLIKNGKLKFSSINALPFHNIFTVKKDAMGKWGKVEALPAEINASNTDVGAESFSPDGKIMFFTLANQDPKQGGGSQVFSVNRTGGEWTKPQKINFYKDSTISVAHPALAPDGETFYFVSDAKGGYGGKDIWKGKVENGECKYITNVGPQINTPGDEMFPYVKSNGDLYFSSDGLPGFGGLDIFKASLSKDSIWLVSNLGAGVNSNADDFGICFDGMGKTGYFSSNRNEVKGYDALYEFEFPDQEISVTGTVRDDQNNPIPEAMVRLVSNKGLNVRVIAKKDGTYKIKVDKDMDCVMLGAARGYLNQSQSFQTQGVKTSKEYKADFKLPAIYRPVQLSNIFFEFNKWNLTSDSETGLKSLVKMLRDNPNIAIEISAHTDYVGSDEVNTNLSQKRAQAVVDYLIQAGIPAVRLSSVGYGKKKPVQVDLTIHNKYPFLGVDKLLEEKYIQTLRPEEQEIANQINRRTEFRVVKVIY